MVLPRGPSFQLLVARFSGIAPKELLDLFHFFQTYIEERWKQQNFHIDNAGALTTLFEYELCGNQMCLMSRFCNSLYYIEQKWWKRIYASLCLLLYRIAGIFRGVKSSYRPLPCIYRKKLRVYFRASLPNCNPIYYELNFRGSFVRSCLSTVNATKINPPQKYPVYGMWTCCNINSNKFVCKLWSVLSDELEFQHQTLEWHAIHHTLLSLSIKRCSTFHKLSVVTAFCPVSWSYSWPAERDQISTACCSLVCKCSQEYWTGRWLVSTKAYSRKTQPDSPSMHQLVW